jgi:pimeloyl-ACP methyl ester carboxylesterase
MPTYQSAGLNLHYISRGAARSASVDSLIFQHGIGGDVRQPSRFLAAERTSVSADDLSILHADFRAHGASPPGLPEHLSIATLASDLVALLDHLGIQRAIAGGISMGAAAALRMAVEYPERCRALILCRPAWTDGPMSQVARDAYALVADLLSAEDWQDSAAASLEESEILHTIEDVCPDAAKSIRGQVQSVLSCPEIRDAAISRLRHLPVSRGLAGGLESLAAVHCPVLILAAEGDPIHPFEFARRLSQHLPNCRLVQIAPKSPFDDRPHLHDVDRLIGEFLRPMLTAEEVVVGPEGFEPSTKGL